MSYGFDGLFQIAVDEAKKQFGEDFNTATTSNWYKATAPIILALTYLEDKFISLKRGRNIYTAQDEEIDDILTNDLVFRIEGAKATGKGVVRGRNETIINIGDIQVKGTNNLIYVNTTGGTITNESIELDFECSELGTQGNIPENNFNSTIKAPVGINDVQNSTSEISGGVDRETDYDYIQRYLITVRNRDWSLPAIKGAIKQLNGVKSCDGLRNNTMQDGIIPKKSMRLVVEGGDEEEIAKTIYLRTHTVNTVGNIEKQIEMVPGQFETIRFDRPNSVSVDYQYIIQSPDKERIVILLNEYLNELGVGELVSAEEFRKAKLDSVTQLNIKVMDLGFKRTSETEFKPYLQLNFDEKGQVGKGEEI